MQASAKVQAGSRLADGRRKEAQQSLAGIGASKACLTVGLVGAAFKLLVSKGSKKARSCKALFLESDESLASLSKSLTPLPVNWLTDEKIILRNVCVFNQLKENKKRTSGSLDQRSMAKS